MNRRTEIPDLATIDPVGWQAHLDRGREMDAMRAALRDGVQYGPHTVLDLNRQIQDHRIVAALPAQQFTFPEEHSSNRFLGKLLIRKPEEKSAYTRQETVDLGLAIRRAVEWAIWSPETAFPYVRDRAEAGEPLGQCLVTARFAMNYFPGSRLAEVRVRNQYAKEVGPHIVLELETRESSDINQRHFLDLTPDQALARGDHPQFVRDLHQWTKVSLQPVTSPNYIFGRYQSDEELATKQSRPLDHFRLFLEMVGFRSGDVAACHGIERYAQEIRIRELKHHQVRANRDSSGGNGLSMDEIKDPKIHDKLTAAIDYISGFQGMRLEVGLISEREFMPKPSWLWEVVGLKGSNKAFILNDGLLQRALLYSLGQIIIVNLRGGFTIDSIAKVGEILSEGEKLNPLLAPSLINMYVNHQQLDGPVLVNEI